MAFIMQKYAASRPIEKEKHFKEISFSPYKDDYEKLNTAGENKNWYIWTTGPLRYQKRFCKWDRK